MEDNGSKGMAVVSLVLGILSLVCCCIGFPFAIVGLILAIIVLAKGKNGKGLAVGGLITSVICLIISAIVGISMIPVMPYMNGFIDLGKNAESYIEDYQENGTYPPVVDQMIEDGLIPEDQADELMDQMVEQLEAAK